MVKLKCWKKSQTSSGYYIKNPDVNGHVFINFRKNPDGSYNVEKRVGLSNPSKFKSIAKGSNKEIAIKKANKYMKSHNKC
ncbi:MAG: hypothetical protein KKB88_00455 [Nanoarchaeota archaeon]|nr:hypothetical protein [Nanoarchaeota archaeon]